MRTPNDNVIINHAFFKEAKKHIQLCFDSYGRSQTPRCTSILGPSGCGKSEAVDDFIRTLKPSKDQNTIQVLKIETPANPTIKSMASEALLSLKDPFYFRGTEVNMTNRILKLLTMRNTQLLVFDELQNLIDKESDKLSYKAAEWVKRLWNRAKLPTIFAGLDRAMEIFLINNQLRRRFMQPYFFKAFDWKQENSRKYLKGFLKGIQDKYCFEDGLKVYNSEMAFRFYCATGGLVGYIMTIILEAERLSIEANLPFIKLEHIAQAYGLAVCGNHLIGINPFLSEDLDRIETALKVVEESNPIKRKDKVRS